MSFIFRTNAFKYIVLSFGIGTSIVLEYNSYYYRNLIKKIKQLPVISLSDPNVLNKLPLTTNNFLFSGRIQSNKIGKIVTHIAKTSYFVLENKHLLMNSTNIQYIHPRKYTIEKLFPHIKMIYNFFFSVFDRPTTSSTRAYEDDTIKRYYNYKLSDLFTYFLNGDQVLLYGENSEDKILKLDNNSLVLKPSIVIQGNKNDLIHYFLNKIDSLFLEKLLIEYPIIVYFIGKLGYYLINKILKKVYKMKKEILQPGQGTCIKCKTNNANVICNTCSYFNLCEHCFDEMKKKCPNCHTEKPKVIIITN